MDSWNESLEDAISILVIERLGAIARPHGSNHVDFGVITHEEDRTVCLAEHGPAGVETTERYLHQVSIGCRIVDGDVGLHEKTTGSLSEFCTSGPASAIARIDLRTSEGPPIHPLPVFRKLGVGSRFAEQDRAAQAVGDVPESNPAASEADTVQGRFLEGLRSADGSRGGIVRTDAASAVDSVADRYPSLNPVIVSRLEVRATGTLERGYNGLARFVIRAGWIVPITDPCFLEEQCVIERLLFQMGKDSRTPKGSMVGPSGRKMFESALVIHHGKGQLPCIARATHSSRCFACLLNCRQE